MKSVLKRGNVIMDNEIKNVFFDIEMLRRRLIRPFFIELGLTVGQGQPRILKELREHGIMNQKELADACLMDVTTMSRTLDRMEKDDLLKRENNPASRRSWNVLLTDYGSQKADEVIRIFNRIDNVIYNGFSEEEVQTLSVMAGKVEKKWNRECCIVFVSNKDDLVFQSLVYHPFFFIRKAHLDEELEPQLLELQKKAGKKVPQIELQTGRQSVKLALRDIWFVESEKNYLLFYREKDTRDEAIRVRMKMSEVEKKLEAHKFVRTHKGYLVNMNYVYRLREKELLLLNGKSIPVSRNYLNQVRMKIMGVVME